MRRLLALAIVLALPIVALQANDEKATQKDAPSFELKDLAGKTHKSSDFKDKILVIEWTEPGCPYIKRHADAGTMKSIAKDYAKKDVVFIGICTSSLTDTKSMAAFAKEKGIQYPILMDETGDVGRAFGATNTPHMFIVKAGKIVYKGAIDDNKRGTKEKPVNFVRAALDELVAGKAVTNSSNKPYG